MLRRIMRTLLIAMSVAGVLLLIWLPISYVLFFEAGYESRKRYVHVVSERGAAELIDLPRPTRPTWASDAEGWKVSVGSTEELLVLASERDTRWLIPQLGGISFSVPLWLLAALCLSWPVASLLLARRRRKGRGFAVEANADSAASAMDS